MASTNARPTPHKARFLLLFPVAAVMLLVLTGAWLWLHHGEALKAGMPIGPLSGLLAVWLCPPVIIWLAGALIALERDLRMTRARLAAPPPEPAPARIESAEAVERDLQRMSKSLEISLRQAGRLREQLSRDLEAMEQSTGRTEQRLVSFGQLMEGHQASMKEIADALAGEESRAGAALGGRIDELRTVSARARNDLEQLSGDIEKGAARLSAAAGKAEASATAASEALARETTRLEQTAGGASALIDGIGESYKNQHKLMDDTAARLSRAHDDLNARFAKNATRLDALAGGMEERGAALSRSAIEMAARIEGALDVAEQRAGQLGRKFSSEVTSMVNAAENAARTVDASARMAAGSVRASAEDFQASEARTRTLMHDAWEKNRNELMAVLADVRAALAAGLIDFTQANGSFSKTMLEMGGAAQTVSEYLEGASRNLQQTMRTLVAAGDERARDLARLLEDHFAALAAPAGLAAAMSEAAASRAGDNSGYWGLTELAAIASALRGGTHEPASADARDLLETLKPHAAVLDSALADPIPAGLVRNGHAPAGSAAIPAATGNAIRLLSGLRRSDASFRAEADRFIASFDSALSNLATERANTLLVEIYLTSDLGKLYLLLVRSSGWAA